MKHKNQKYIRLPLSLLFSLSLVVTLSTQRTYAASVMDDFEDGDSVGWVATKPCLHCGSGNWRVESGVVVQDEGRDNYMFVLEDHVMATQSLQADVLNYDNGQAGLTVWYQDYNNWVQVQYPYFNGYTSTWGFNVKEMVDGDYTWTHYPFDFGLRTWRVLKLDVDSTSGELAVYIDDVLALTHTLRTSHREGLSGFSSSNAGGNFDNFVLTDEAAPSSKDECKKGGWETFTNPSFKNQGQCVSYVQKQK
jgi:hypothetical protein